MYGYMGKILRVDLSKRSTSIESLDEEIAKMYIGGRGFGVKVLFDELTPGINPLSENNKLIFSTGPFVGTLIPGSSRCVVMAKSPLTGLLGDTDFGGYFPKEMKSTGFDAIIIEGKAEKPVYLWIHDGTVEIKDATHLWGKVTSKTQEEILREIKDSKAKIVCIGPGGENLVRYACIVSELRYVGGRLGLGAVMGSKNLKAVVVRGEKKVAIAKEKELDTLVKALNYDLVNDGSCESLMEYGTWNSTAPAQLKGILPTKNFQKTSFEGIDKIDGDAMVKKILVGRRTCYACPIRCRRVVEAETPYKVSPEYGGPQYEAVASLGPLCLNDNPVAIAKANELCNEYSLDVISTGVCIAFAMECFEKGVLTKEDIGFPLKWGNHEAMMRLIEMIAKREGIGDILAEGLRRAASRIQGGSEKWAIHVKGLEMAMHDPRGKKGIGLSYATSHKGADHMESMHDEAFERDNALPELGFTKSLSRKSKAGKALLVKTLQDYWGTMADCLVSCKLPFIPPRPFTPTRAVEALNNVTGWDLSLDEFVLAGERVFNLCRIFNVREGVRRKDDVLPERLGETLKEGGSAGESFTKDDLDSLLDEYYSLRGWTKDGVPTKETLHKLGLEYVASELKDIID